MEIIKDYIINFIWDVLWYNDKINKMKELNNILINEVNKLSKELENVNLSIIKYRERINSQETLIRYYKKKTPNN